MMQKHIIGVLYAELNGEHYEALWMAAIKGWGPFIWDVAMKLTGQMGLMPDRDLVSNDATKMFSKYYERDDVEHIPLKKMRSVTLTGGVKSHDLPELNQAYRFKANAGPDINDLKKNNDALNNKHFHMVSGHIMKAAEEFFVRRNPFKK